MSDALPTPVPVRNPEGELVTLPASELSRALSEGGYKPVSDQEIAHERQQLANQEKYGGVAGGAEALGLGALRSITGGGFDYIASEAGGRRAREHIKGIDETHPIASTVGEIAPYLFPAVGAVKGITGMGSLAARGAAKLVGEGVAGKIGQSVARVGAEAAMMSAADVISEDSLSNHPEQIAEHLLPHMAKGALLGSVLGGAIGGFGALRSARKLVAPITEAASKAESRIAEEAIPVSEKAAEETAPLGAPEAVEASSMPATPIEETTVQPASEKPLTKQQAARAAQKAEVEKALKREVSRAEKSATEAYNEALEGGMSPKKAEVTQSSPVVEEAPVDPLEPKVPFRERVAQTLNEKANETLLTSLDPLAKHLRQAQRFGGGIQELAGNIMEAAKTRSKTPLSFFTDKTWEKLWADLKSEGVGLLEKSMTGFEESGVKADSRKVISDLEDYANSYLSKTGQESKASAAHDLISSFRKNLARLQDERPHQMYGSRAPGEIKAGDTIAPRKLWELRQHFDDLADKLFQNAPAEGAAAKEMALDMRGIVENNFLEMADKASQESGGGLYQDYLKGKKLYKTGSYLETVLGDNEIRGLRNSKVGLINAMAGAGATAHFGLTAGVIAPFAAKVVRDRAPYFSAQLLHKTARLMAVDKASIAAEKEIGEGIAAFLRPSAAVNINAQKALLPVVFAGHTAQERSQAFEKYTKDLKDRVADPQLQFQHISDNMGTLPQTAPQVAAQIIQKSQAKDAYLAKQIPSGQTNMHTIFPSKAAPKVSDAEIAKFGRKVDVANRGVKVLVEELKSGAVNPETVEATEAIYPTTYEKLRAQILAESAKLEHDLSYKQKLQLQKVYKQPTADVYTPERQQMLQAIYDRRVKKAQNGGGSRRGGGGGGGGGKSVHYARYYTTPIGALEQGD